MSELSYFEYSIIFSVISIIIILIIILLAFMLWKYYKRRGSHASLTFDGVTDDESDITGIDYRTTSLPATYYLNRFYSKRFSTSSQKF